MFCICEKKHSYKDCYYLNEKIRSKSWTLKSEIVIKIKKTMKDSKKKRQIKQNIIRKNEKRQKKDDNKDTKEIKFFVIIKMSSVIKSFTSDFFINYAFRSLWVLNHDSNIHVINKTMKQRFQKKRDYTDEFVVISDMKSLSILIYDRIRIIVNTLTEKKLMKFLNVSYVLDFMINIISIQRIIIFIKMTHLLFSFRE